VFSAIPRELLSRKYGDVRRTLIDPDLASAEHIPGDPQAMRARASEEFARDRYRDRNPPHSDTTTVNVVDGNGNMFSATPSGAWLPALVVAQTGIPLTQRAQSFVLTPGHPNRLEPGKRPRITLTPTLVLEAGKPRFALSTPCGDGQEQTLLQIFLNVVEFGMDPQQAIEAPRFNSNAMFSSFGTHADQPLSLELEGRIPEGTRRALQDKGHRISVAADWGNSCHPTMIEYDADRGVIKGAADVRGQRYALGW
jgi:gamma-glutamyltranspeptidase/glutathione hydrolase